MDISTVGGLALAISSLIISVLAEGGTLGALWNLPAFIIVFGGSLGAAIVFQPLAVTLKVMLYTRQAIFSSKLDLIGTVDLMTRLARIARREGVLALEGEMLMIEDLFIRRGIQLVVDGTDPEVTESILNTEVSASRQRHQTAASFFNTMGGLLPTLGVTGTVMGLINMLGKLDDPGSMGHSIAAAFVATLYGVAAANIFFLPIAGKLKVRSAQEERMRQMIIIGIRGLQSGDSPIVLTERLKAFLSPKERLEVEAKAESMQGVEA